MAGTDLYPVAGKRFYIGGVMATKKTDFVAADFAGQSWIEIDGWETHGSIGDAGALITTALINRGRDVKQKGTANGGSMQNNFAILTEDLGQIALIAAAQPANKNNYAFKIEGNDAPASGSDPTPSMRMFVGLAMNASEQGGNANTAQMLQSTVEVNSNIVKVAATAGA